MAGDYKYVAVITGILRGRNRANAYLQAAMGINLSMRLLQTPHDIAIEVEEIETKHGEGEVDRVPPFNLPVAESSDDGNQR